MSMLEIKEVYEDGSLKSYSSFVIEDGVVYTNPIHGFGKDKVGEVKENGDIVMELKPI